MVGVAERACKAGALDARLCKSSRIHRTGLNIDRSKNVVSIVVNHGENRIKHEQVSRKWLFGFHCSSLAFLGLV
jgi:hypothetical protein